MTGQRRGLEDHTYGMGLTRKGIYLYHPSLKVGRLQFLFFQVNNNLTLLNASLIRLYDNNIKFWPGTFFITIHAKQYILSFEKGNPPHMTYCGLVHLQR